MKQRFFALFAALSLVLIVAGAQAQKKPDKMGSDKMGPGKMAQPAPAAGAPVKGIVKSAPTGKTFMLAQGKKTTTVDASKATVRYNGKFFSLDKLTSGSFVSITGAMNGTTLNAKQVEITKLSGAKPTPPGGKM